MKKRPLRFVKMAFFKGGPSDLSFTPNQGSADSLEFPRFLDLEWKFPTHDDPKSHLVLNRNFSFPFRQDSYAGVGRWQSSALNFRARLDPSFRRISWRGLPAGG